MKHSVTQRLAAGALSALLVVGSLPTSAFADALHEAQAAHALATQGAGTWEHDASGWHYRLPSGLASGWQNVDGTWYLFDGAGTMLTGWQYDGNTWYYLGKSGGMYSARWLLDGNTWYYLLPSGAMATGWAFINGAWYYFYPWGVMASETIVDDCWLRGDGAWDNDAQPDYNYEMAELTTTSILDPSATSAIITVTTDDEHPFASDLSASTIELVGDLYDSFAITSVNRTDTHNVEIGIEGAFSEDAGFWGSGILFNLGSFANPEVLGIVGISTDHQDAVVVVDESSYDETTGLFNVTINTQSASVLRNTSAELSADLGFEVKNVELDADANKVVAQVKAPGDTPYEQLEALSAAIALGGLTVTGTNIGDVPAYFSEEDFESLVDYLTPNAYFYVERGAEGKGWRMSNDGGAEIVLRLRLESENGSFNLSSAGFDFETDDVNAGDYQVIDDNKVEFVAEKLSAKQLQSLMDELEYEDQEEFLNSYTFHLGNTVAEGLELIGGVTDEWGVSLPEEYGIKLNVYNNVGTTETTPEEQAALETQANDPRDTHERDTKIMKAVGQVSQTLTLAAGALAALAMGGPVIAAVGLIAGIFGLIADALTPKGFTEKEVFDAMVSLEHQLDGISSQIGDINTALNALSADITYQTQANELKDLVDKAKAFHPYVVELQNATKDASDRATFNVISAEDYKSSVTGKAMRRFWTRTKFIEREVGEGMSAYNVATRLADLITGNGAVGAQGVVQGYFDVTANMVNWEPETYYMRNTFIVYVGGAFLDVYAAAKNELNWQYREAKTENEKFIIQQSMVTLAQKESDVSKLIGQDVDAQGNVLSEGTLIAGTKDRTDGKVRCTVDGRLYEKAKSDTDTPSFKPVLNNVNDQDFIVTFDNLLDKRDDGMGSFFGYSNPSTLTKSNLDTMVSRLPNVRKQPGYNVSSLWTELSAVGILTNNPPDHIDATDVEKSHWEKTTRTWKYNHQYRYAIVGNAKQVNSSNMSSVYHKRWYNCDMYDLKTNSFAGSEEIFYFNDRYKCASGWWIDLEIDAPNAFIGTQG